MVDASQPVLALEMEVVDTHCSAMHSHPRGQLIYSKKGVMKVKVKDSIWLVSPRQAIWVPSELEHQAFFLKENQLRNLFFDPSLLSFLPSECFVFDVSPFFRELVIKIIHQLSEKEQDKARVATLCQVLYDELKETKPAPSRIPLSDEPRVKQVIDALVEAPEDKRTLDEFAELVCTTPRTLSRLFVKELGMTFSNWQKQWKLMSALEKLEQGQSITQIAYDLGYSSPSAFIHMFSSTFGITPSKVVGRQS